ncbi:hypothetical protein Tco_1115706 [Tanacetum coccineum]
MHLAVHSIKQREGESVRAFTTRYTDDTLQILGLHEDQRISEFAHGLKARNLVEHLSTDLPSTYKGLMEKTYTWIEVREVATNGAPDDRRDNFERGPNHELLSSLSKSLREILAIEKVAKTFEQPPRLPRSKWSQDKTKYFHFHEDHGHDTNQYQELKHQIEKAVKSGRLAHLVKDIKKRKEKVSDTQLGEWKGERKKAKPTETPVLMISRKSCIPRKDIRKKTAIKSLQIESNTLLIGFSREYSWPLGEVPMEITIGEGLLTITKMLNFITVRSDSPHNLLMGRTAMQQMGILVSTIHRSIKFYSPKGIGTLLSENSS